MLYNLVQICDYLHLGFNVNITLNAQNIKVSELLVTFRQTITSQPIFMCTCLDKIPCRCRAYCTSAFRD